MMALTSTNPLTTTRLQRLHQFSQALEQRKDLNQTFQALDVQDRTTLLAQLKITSCVEVETKNLRKRAQKIVKDIAQKIGSLTLDKFPRILLSEILSYTGESPTTIALVCREFNRAQKDAYKNTLIHYAHDPRMATVTHGLKVKEAHKMTKQAAREQVLKIYKKLSYTVRETNATKFVQQLRTKGASPLALGPIAEEVQKIKDHDLIVFFEQGVLPTIRQAIREQRIIVKGQEIDELEAISNPTMQAANIRAWMKKHVSILKAITLLHLDRVGLRTIPPEVGLLVNLKIFSFNGNEIREIPKEIGKLRKLEHGSMEGNPLSYVAKISLIFLFSLPDTSKRSSIIKHYPLLQKLLLEASKTRGKQPVQDRFSDIIKRSKDPGFRNFIEGLLFTQSLDELVQIWRINDANEQIHLTQQLPQALRHRIYAFTTLLEKRKGTEIDHRHFGQMAFRNQGKNLSDPSIRSKAIQLALLERIFVHMEKSGRDNIADLLFAQFNQFDAFITSRVYHHLYVIEKKAGRAKNHPKFAELAFRYQQGFTASNRSRIQAIRIFLKELERDALKK